MDSLKHYEDFKPLNEGVMTLDQIIAKDIRIGDLKGNDVNRLIGSTVHQIPVKAPVSSRGAAISSSFKSAMNIEDKKPKLYLKDKAGKPLCILV